MLRQTRCVWRIFLSALCLAGLTSIQLRAEANVDTSSRQTFELWLAADSKRAEDYADFKTLLGSRGVGDVVPPWQLWRVDAQHAVRCETEGFHIPPRTSWPAIVPALRLVRDEVVPAVGPVEVLSAWRSEAINSCVNGARRSKHLMFNALDLTAVEGTERTVLFRKLCKLQERVGQRRRMGFGAYFDPARPERNRVGRFHIDAEGFRTWGFDYTSKSNPCPLLD